MLPKVRAQEAKELNALRKYKDRENYIVYHSMRDIEEELGATLSDNKPKYSLAMQIEIVENKFSTDGIALAARCGLEL